VVALRRDPAMGPGDSSLYVAFTIDGDDLVFRDVGGNLERMPLRKIDDEQ
jgi:hypothetical protein